MKYSRSPLLRHETYGIPDNPVGEVPDPHIILVEEHLECLQAAFLILSIMAALIMKPIPVKKRG